MAKLFDQLNTVITEQPSFLEQWRPRLPGLLKPLWDRLLDPEKSVDFFFGAGMSLAAKTPDAKGLAYKLLRGTIFPDDTQEQVSESEIYELISHYPFEAIVSATMESSAGGTGVNELIKNNCNPVFTPEEYPQHADFATICNLTTRPSVRYIFTTNFDQLLKQALGEQAYIVTEENCVHFDHGLPTRIPIIHLHGVFAPGIDTRTCENDVYDSDERKHKQMLQIFDTALHTSDAIVFIGYSMRDPELHWIYRRYYDTVKDRKNAKFTCFVSPPYSEPDCDFAQKLWASRGATWLPLSATEFFAVLKEALTTAVNHQMKQEIIKKFVLASEQDLDEKISAVMKLLAIERDEAVHFLRLVRPKTGGAL